LRSLYYERSDLTYGTDEEMEKVYRQYVSGWMFGSFGLRPAAGRLFTEHDDTKPGGHHLAVLSYDYWKRRFALGPKVVGRTFRMGNDLYEIVGVVADGFTGTETGTVIDVFLPTMMHAGVPHSDWNWFRPLAHLDAGVDAAVVQDILRVPYKAFQEERARGFTHMPQSEIKHFLADKMMLDPAASGVSELQKDYRTGLAALGVLVALVLLIACANVANLMTAQAAARAREMALRVSIGAGRWRLVQLVLLESAWIACLAASIGALIAWRSAPFVVSMINPANNPAPAGPTRGLARVWIRPCLGIRRHVAVRPRPGLARVVGEAGQRAQRWRRSTLATPAHAWTHRRASSRLLSGALRRGPVHRDV
jgi:hypothetical protein